MVMLAISRDIALLNQQLHHHHHHHHHQQHHQHQLLQVTEGARLLHT
jgi:hypothetical protein